MLEFRPKMRAEVFELVTLVGTKAGRQVRQRLVGSLVQDEEGSKSKKNVFKRFLPTYSRYGRYFLMI